MDAFFEKYLETTDEYFRDNCRNDIQEMDEEQRAQLKKLILRMEAAGCTEPLPWAVSEIDEGIPQFARYRVMSELINIAEDTDRGAAYAGIYSDTFDALHEKIRAAVGEDLLKEYLQAYGKGLMGEIVEFIDNGNETAERDQLNWVLTETYTGEAIDCLHEDFGEFEK